MSTDHFSAVAAQYAQSRPTYPDELFAWLAGQCASQALAWDVGAGNGQASVALAAHFDRVLATDLSEEQIREATPHPRIEYRVAPAERSGLAAGSADLVTVAQALHWFDLDAFYAEVRRVLRPSGVVAAWTYGVLSVGGAAVDGIVDHYYREVVGPYWPAERRHVESGYAQLAFPFRSLSSPVFVIRRQWGLDALLGYMRSWSATARMHKATGVDPVREVERSLGAAWGARDSTREVSWPIAMRVGTLR
ncbi:MAG TPA: class I SAM-dependent methyltransferase [Albitalea sp.]|uniref:class I SAM-dependent methyltransferase n=1 Tax=Piscinibacter sp. TaxID=1903157 RepID=UPI002ED6A067